MDPNAMQVAGTHYEGAYQHWDYVQKALQGRYLEGNATKYVARARKKNGKQDYEKSKHYVVKLLDCNLSLTNWNYVVPLGMTRSSSEKQRAIAECGKFCVANKLDSLETEIMLRLTLWENAGQLEEVIKLLDLLITRSDYNPHASLLSTIEPKHD